MLVTCYCCLIIFQLGTDGENLITLIMRLPYLEDIVSYCSYVLVLHLRDLLDMGYQWSSILYLLYVLIQIIKKVIFVYLGKQVVSRDL